MAAHLLVTAAALIASSAVGVHADVDSHFPTGPVIETSAGEAGSVTFKLTRRNIAVPANSSLHHRHGVIPRRQYEASATRALLSGIGDVSTIGDARRAQDEVPVYGDFRRLAYFFADVFIGSVPQKFTVITDTGSSLTAVPCIDCGDCGQHMNPRFDPARSTTAVAMTCSAGCPGNSHCSSGTCQYTQSYAEGSSLRGKLYKDSVYVGGDGPGGTAAGYTIPFTFGCGVHEGGLFVSQEADGIMGLGQTDMSITRALWEAHKLEANVFSLCLALNGGAFTLGRIDSRLHAGSIQWARMSLTGFYVVSITGMAVGGAPVVADGFNSPHTILDSGTTFTYVPHNTYSDVRRQIDSYCSADRTTRCKGAVAQIQGEPLCYRIPNPADIATFPSISISMGGFDGQNVVLDVPPQHVFINMGWDNGAYCLAMYDNGNNGGVIGANAMMGHDVIFDMAGDVSAGTGPRAGFVASTCVSPDSPMPQPGEQSASPSPTPSQTPTATPTPSPSTSTPASASAPPPAQVSPSPAAGAGSDPGTATTSPAPAAASPSAGTTATASPAAATDKEGGDSGTTPPDSVGNANSLVIAASVIGTLLSMCLLAYCCFTCECRLGRLVVRLETSNGKGGGAANRYQPVVELQDEDGAAEDGGRAAAATAPRRAGVAGRTAAAAARPPSATSSSSGRATNPAASANNAGAASAQQPQDEQAAARSKIAAALSASKPAKPAAAPSAARVQIEVRDGDTDDELELDGDEEGGSGLGEGNDISGGSDDFRPAAAAVPGQGL